MFHYLIPVFFLNFTIIHMFGDVAYAIVYNETSKNLLDSVTDLIEKAVLNLPQCQGSIAMPVDCEDILRNGQTKTGEYTIWLRNRVTGDRPLRVSCDMETDGGGWTVIQRRGDFGRSKDFFFKDWENYKNGFGDVDEDFWLGNDNIFALTNQRLYSILFDMNAVDGEWRTALYDTFWIDDEDHMYTLHIKDYKGDAGDSMTIQHDKAQFSTMDKDNDGNNERNCASEYKGGWWYNSCHHSNLNGLYLKGHHKTFADGVNWSSWRHFNESLVFTEMKIRPKSLKKSALQ